MSREIKFRAWSEYSNKMVDWESMINEESSMSVLNGEDEKIHVMQFTGLHDKNGKEIYEGDIIRIYNNELDEDDSWIDEVSYHLAGFFSGKEDLLGNVHFRAKAIGNIYENPELING